MRTTAEFTSVDLFAGCGGLSLGLHWAGFRTILAVEKSDMAAESYYHNFVRRVTETDEWIDHLESPIHEQAEQGLAVAEVGAVLASGDLMDRLRRQEVDLLAGGPPCQGFSLAGRRNPLDVRNQLPWAG